jgi:predicted DNA-binding protein with PD1-like motif
MKFRKVKTGRTFVLRLEDGDVIHTTIENFCKQHNLKAGYVTILGGADKGSVLVVGPENGRTEKIVPMETVLKGVCEFTGTGTIFSDKDTGEPLLHMHISCGRKNNTITGCVRKGVKIWYIGEVIIQEILTDNIYRKFEHPGFKLLNVSDKPEKC